MDIQVRGQMNGIEAARRIHDHWSIPVVFLTAHSDEATVASASHASAYGYLRKPFDESELRAAIEIALHKHRAEKAELSREAGEREVERWKQMDLLKTQFLNVAAHELRNPVTALVTMLSVLERRFPELAVDHGEGAPLAVLERSIRRIQRLTDDLLDGATLQAMQLSVSKTRADLYRIVTASVADFRQQAERQNVHLEVPASEPIWIDVDPDRLGQVIENLLLNALKFTPRGGRIKISTRVEASTAILEVEDTGTGIRREDLPLVFQPFTSLPADEDPRMVPGTGLGLFLSKGIVELHGSRIDVSSGGPGEGSTFTVTLPIAS